MGRYLNNLRTVATVMNVTENTVNTWIKKEKLKSIFSKNGKKMVMVNDLYEFISTNKRYNNLLHRYKSEFEGRSRLLNRLMNQSMNDNMFTPQEVATVMNVTLQTVRRWIIESKLEVARDSHRRFVIPIHSIRNFLDNNKKYNNLIERYISEITSISIVLDELLIIENYMIITTINNIKSGVDKKNVVMRKIAEYNI